jgi:hypothetical protein
MLQRKIADAQPPSAGSAMRADRHVIKCGRSTISRSEVCRSRSALGSCLLRRMRSTDPGVLPYPPPSSQEADVIRFQRVADMPTRTETLSTISPLGDDLLRTVLGDLDRAREGIGRRRRTLRQCATGQCGYTGSDHNGLRRWERLYGVPGVCATVQPSS